jgi:hypothetical protein
MYIKNLEDVGKEKLFHCKSLKLMRFLTERHSIVYVNKKEVDAKCVWIFFKTPLLDKALTEWADNKKNGTLAYD